MLEPCSSEQNSSSENRRSVVLNFGNLLRHPPLPAEGADLFEKSRARGGSDKTNPSMQGNKQGIFLENLTILGFSAKERRFRPGAGN
jgi:hypothetical protein